jgi:hypothetical protein
MPLKNQASNPKKLNLVIVDLERRFSLAMGMREINNLFYGAIHNYVELTREAFEVSPSWYDFYVREHTAWKDIVDKSAANDLYFMGAYRVLYDMYDQIEKIRAEVGSGRTISKVKKDSFKPYLQRVHSAILAKLEEDRVDAENFKQEEAAVEARPSFAIEYNPMTGIGYLNSKRFKFQARTPKFFLFGKLYEQIGVTISKEDVLKITNYQGRRQMYFINELAKDIRKKLDLTPDELVANVGNLTLTLKKLETSPK